MRCLLRASSMSRSRTRIGFLLIVVIQSSSLAVGSYAQPHQLRDSSLAAGCALVASATIIDGHWEVLLLDLVRQQVLRLTQSFAEANAPAWSPLGDALAFAGQRGGNWDLYRFSLIDGSIQQLTDSPAYDGQPAWSPTGTQLSFESYADGNSQVYIMPSIGGAATRVTKDKAAEVEPIWTGDGQGLIYGSWRTDARQLYQHDLLSGVSTSLTEPGEEARQPALSPDGRQLAYIVSQDTYTRVVVQDMATGERFQPSSDDEHLEWPNWSQVNSSDPARLFSLKLVSPDPDRYPVGWTLVAQSAGSNVPLKRLPFPLVSRQWMQPRCAPGTATRPTGNWRAIQQIFPPAQPFAAPGGLTFLPGVQARQPRLVAAVAPSFQRLRNQIRVASGHGYLDTLNDVWRGLDHPGGAYLSWHKTGRAIDVRDWYAPGGKRVLFMSRQSLGGQTFFRLYLYAARQDGSQGTPLRESIWETDGRLARSEWAKAGGRSLPPPIGYFVDFTDLAEREAWTRIPALSPPDGDWRRSYLDLEFWHYERRDGLQWYDAMQQLYSENELSAWFTPDRLLARGYDAAMVNEAGIVSPASALCLKVFVGQPC